MSVSFYIWGLFFFVPFRCCCAILSPLGDDDDEASTEHNMAAVSPIPKIVTTSIKEDFCREEEEDCRDELGKSESWNIVTKMPLKQMLEVSFNQI